MRRLAPVLALCLLLLRPAAAEEPSALRTIDVAQDCVEAVPEAVAVGQTGGRISLDVALVADRKVTKERAETILQRTTGAYAPLGIDVRLHSVRSSSLVTQDAFALLDEAKSLFGGARPAGADLVAVITSADLFVSEAGIEARGVLGAADCIGGIRYPSRAFLVAEDTKFTLSGLDDMRGVQFGPINFFGNLAAKVLAHEAAHLLGAHHHYANCAEGATSEVGEVSPCTLMFNDASVISINFGALESAIVRGHAESYAR